MHIGLLEWLACPVCHTRFTLEGDLRDVISTGILRCAQGHGFHVINGIPRFVQSTVLEEVAQRTRTAFGYEWTKYADYDVQNFHTQVFNSSTDFFAGKLGLDAGAGAGRHLMAAVRAGATMVGVDGSTAVDVIQQRAQDMSHVHVIHADLNSLPFASRPFDFAYSWGVLQHTSDPEHVFQYITACVKPGGTVVIGLYHASWRKRLLEIPRWFTTRLPVALTQWIARLCALIDYGCCILPYRLITRMLGTPLSWMPSHIREYARYPYAVSEADWLDRLIAPMTNWYTREQVAGWFARAGLEDVQITEIDDFWWRGEGRVAQEHLSQAPVPVASMTHPPRALPQDARILLMNLAGIGDLILSVPTVATIRARYPQHTIDLVTASHAADVLMHCPDINTQYTLTSTRESSWWQLPLRDRQVLQTLRAQHYTVVMNMYWVHSSLGAMRLAYYLRRIRAAHRLGYDTHGAGWCFSHAIRETRSHAMHMHESVHAMQLASLLDCPPVDIPPTLWVTEEEHAQARALLMAQGIDATRPYIVLSHGARQQNKSWSPGCAHVLSAWCIDQGLQVVCVGDVTDQHRHIAMPPSVVNVTGRTSIRELMGIVQGAHAVISTDTGVMHMAAALHRPLVALFGPTSMRRYAPRENRSPQRMVQAPSQCMEDISVDMVQQAITDLGVMV
jgi:ADP-heptose:LPS heptosyltransferase/SAM-dependent methyltransferase